MSGYGFQAETGRGESTSGTSRRPFADLILEQLDQRGKLLAALRADVDMLSHGRHLSIHVFLVCDGLGVSRDLVKPLVTIDLIGAGGQGGFDEGP